MTNYEAAMRIRSLLNHNFRKTHIFGDKFVEALRVAVDVLNSTREGYWYGEADGYVDGKLVYDEWFCSACGKHFTEWDDKPTWKYCPECGVRMTNLND